MSRRTKGKGKKEKAIHFPFSIFSFGLFSEPYLAALHATSEDRLPGREN